MKHDPIVYVKHILDAIQSIETFVKDVDKEVFYRDQKTQYSVFKALEIIGEASKNIPQQLKSEYTMIPWRVITDAKNVFVHEYFDIDLSEVWNTIQKDLPMLKMQIQKIIDAGKDQVRS